MDETMKTALGHLRIIDLTHYMAGPYCAKLMAGFGAEVIKIERPGTGDGLRGLGPFYRDKADGEHSIPFLWLNTGKKSVTLNLKSERGIAIFKELIREADVVLENFAPRVMPSLGVGYDVIRDVNPRIVMTSISNFGQSGPYRDYKTEEIVTYALSGQMSLTGDPDRPPLASGPALCQYSAGQHAYVATLMALFQRSGTGDGQQVDVSILECALESVEMAVTNSIHLGKTARRAKHVIAPWDLYPCSDGYAAVISGPFRHWSKGAEIFQEPKLLDPKFRHVIDRITHRDEVEALILPWLRTQTKEAVFLAGQEHRLGFGFLADFEKVRKLPQHQRRGFFVAMEHPAVGTHDYCGAPFKMHQTPWQNARAPLLGEHNREVYGDGLGFSPAEMDTLGRKGVI